MIKKISLLIISIILCFFASVKIQADDLVKTESATVSVDDDVNFFNTGFVGNYEVTNLNTSLTGFDPGERGNRNSRAILLLEALYNTSPKRKICNPYGYTLSFMGIEKNSYNEFEQKRREKLYDHITNMYKNKLFVIEDYLDTIFKPNSLVTYDFNKKSFIVSSISVGSLDYPFEGGIELTTFDKRKRFQLTNQWIINVDEANAELIKTRQSKLFLIFKIDGIETKIIENCKYRYIKITPVAWCFHDSDRNKCYAIKNLSYEDIKK